MLKLGTFARKPMPHLPRITFISKLRLQRNQFQNCVDTIQPKSSGFAR